MMNFLQICMIIFMALILYKNNIQLEKGGIDKDERDDCVNPL